MGLRSPAPHRTLRRRGTDTANRRVASQSAVTTSADVPTLARAPGGGATRAEARVHHRPFVRSPGCGAPGAPADPSLPGACRSQGRARCRRTRGDKRSPGRLQPDFDSPPTGLFHVKRRTTQLRSGAFPPWKALRTVLRLAGFGVLEPVRRRGGPLDDLTLSRSARNGRCSRPLTQPVPYLGVVGCGGRGQRPRFTWNKGVGIGTTGTRQHERCASRRGPGHDGHRGRRRSVRPRPLARWPTGPLIARPGARP